MIDWRHALHPPDRMAALRRIAAAAWCVDVVTGVFRRAGLGPSPWFARVAILVFVVSLAPVIFAAADASRWHRIAGLLGLGMIVISLVIRVLGGSFDLVVFYLLSLGLWFRGSVGPEWYRPTTPAAAVGLSLSTAAVGIWLAGPSLLIGQLISWPAYVASALAMVVWSVHDPAESVAGGAHQPA
jgi:hypothetical protein